MTTNEGRNMKYTNYPPGVREWDFIGDEEEVEEQEDSNFEDYYYDLKKERPTVKKDRSTP